MQFTVVIIVDLPLKILNIFQKQWVLTVDRLDRLLSLSRLVISNQLLSFLSI